MIQASEEKKRIRNEVKERTLSYIVAAFGLVAGLAWNDAIKSLIEALFPFENGSLMAKFAYAVLVTLAVVVITIYLTKAITKQEGRS